MELFHPGQQRSPQTAACKLLSKPNSLQNTEEFFSPNPKGRVSCESLRGPRNVLSSFLLLLLFITATHSSTKASAGKIRDGCIRNWEKVSILFHFDYICEGGKEMRRSDEAEKELSSLPLPFSSLSLSLAFIPFHFLPPTRPSMLHSENRCLGRPWS